MAVTAGPHLGENRNEGQGKRALGEQPAHEVGNLERKKEGVRCRARTEITREYHVANEAENARSDRRGADFRRRSQQLHRRLPGRI